MAKRNRLGRLATLGGLTTRLSSSYVGQRIKEAFTDEEGRQALRDRFQMQSAEQLASTLGRLRGAAQKFGQSLSMAAEHLDLPDEVRAQLAKLQSEGEPIPFETIRATLERELGDLDARFAQIDPAPLGTASLAQAHAARLVDGTEVVVKVLHEGVDESVEADLLAVRAFIASARTLGGRSRAEMDGIYDEVRERLMEELDYLQEAANIHSFRQAFGDSDPRVRIPRQHNRLCTERVLVLDRLPGRSLRAFLADSNEEQRQAAGVNLAGLFFSMAFKHRILHADPHPGNYLFEDDGRIGLLDFGCVKRFRPSWIGRYAQAALGAVEGDREMVLKACYDMGAWDGEDAKAADAIWEFCDTIVGPWRGREYAVGSADDDILERVQPVARRIWESPGVTAPRDIIFLHRTLGGVYTIGRQLGVRARWDEMVRQEIQPALKALESL